jgi:hypothetical protein
MSSRRVRNGQVKRLHTKVELVGPEPYAHCSISRELSRYYHDTCEKCSFVALLDNGRCFFFYVLEWSPCLSDPAKSLVVEPDRQISKILVFRPVFGAVFSSIIE